MRTNGVLGGLLVALLGLPISAQPALAAPGVIEGSVFRDSNQNGVQDLATGGSDVSHFGRQPFSIPPQAQIVDGRDVPEVYRELTQVSVL